MRLSSFILPALILFAFSCKQPELQRISIQGKAQGTYYSIIYFDSEGRNFQKEIDSLLDNYNTSVSLYDSNSIISRINRNEAGVMTDSHFRANFIFANRVARETYGAFDFTIGQLVNAWGFGLKNRDKIDTNMIKTHLSTVDYTAVSIENDIFVKQNKQTLIDFNAVAQGYSVDLTGAFLESKGIMRYLVDIGGEVLCKGRKEANQQWSVGIELPVDNTSPDKREIKAIVSLEDKALATSGNYRKFYIRDGIKYSHTIDPKTGYPVNHSLLSASVFATSAGMADAYATAFMVMGLEKTKGFLKTHPELSVYLIYSDTAGVLKTFVSDNLKMLIEEK